MPIKELTGNIYTRLTVLSYAGKNKHNKALWNCSCSCGQEKIIAGYTLISGCSKSCGCLRIESITSHKLTKTPAYKTWVAMRSRCNNPKNTRFADYGGRGILVCPRWNSFENFLTDMGERPDNHTIDRIKTDENYTPANCRWASSKIQANNRATNRSITFIGRTLNISQWSEFLHIHKDTLTNRINKGWPTHDAFLTPVRRRNK